MSGGGAVLLGSILIALLAGGWALAAILLIAIVTAGVMGAVLATYRKD